MVGAKLGMFAVAVPLAFLWWNYWALVAGIVAGVDPPTTRRCPGLGPSR